MEKVAICLVTKNLFKATKLFIENILQNTQWPYEFYICDCGSSDKEQINYLANICLKTGGKFVIKKNPNNFYEAYNLLIKECRCDFIALMTINIIVDANWLAELFYTYNNLPNPGCLSVRGPENKVELTTTLHKNSEVIEDELKTIWFCKEAVFDMPIFFHKDRLEKTGLIDISKNYQGWAFLEFTFRFLANGFENFYVKNTMCLKPFLEDSFLLPHLSKAGREIYKNEVNKMLKTSNFKK